MRRRKGDEKIQKKLFAPVHTDAASDHGLRCVDRTVAFREGAVPLYKTEGWTLRQQQWLCTMQPSVKPRHILVCTRTPQRKRYKTFSAKTVGCLGVTGEGKATTWRVTELGTPTNHLPSKDYTNWSEGNDFQVAEGKRLRSGIK